MKILKYIFISMTLFLFINNLIFMLVFSLSDDYQSLKNGHKDIIGKDHLIIGDSHSSYGIKNEHLSKFFYNFSFPGESIIANNYKIKKNFRESKIKIYCYCNFTIQYICQPPWSFKFFAFFS